MMSGPGQVSIGMTPIVNDGIRSYPPATGQSYIPRREDGVSESDPDYPIHTSRRSGSPPPGVSPRACISFVASLIIMLVVWIARGSRQSYTPTNYKPTSYDYKPTNYMSPRKVIKSVAKCESVECLEATRKIMSYMNTSVSPCDDFYSYACGKWGQEHNFSDCDFGSDTYTELTKKNFKVLRHILEVVEETTGAIKKAKDFYSSCVKTNETVGICLKLELENMFNRKTNITWISVAQENDTMDDPESRAINCTKLTLVNFPDITAYLFMKDNFGGSKRAAVFQLVQQMVTSFSTKVGYRVFDIYTMKYIRNAFSKLHTILGAPSKVMLTLLLDLMYSKLEISDQGDMYLDNLEKIREANITSKKWANYTTIANAFYSPNMDELFIPAGITQEPFFSEKYIDILNYGMLGTTIAHELSHVFQIYIDHVDPLTVQRLPWMERLDVERSLLQFKNFKKCIVRQYIGLHSDANSYQSASCPNLTHITLDEDVADILGLNVAFVSFLENHHLQMKLPTGVGTLSKEQLFFIVAAQVHCATVANWTIFVCDEHSPERFRVMGSMMNLNEFAEAFQCPIGSKYNPVNKCQLFKN